MGAGYTCMKYLFVVLNILFLLLAVCGIGISVWMFVDPTIPLHFTQESKDYLITTIIILLASVILLIVSILGIYSVAQEARKALVASFCLLLIIVVAEIAAGVWGYINRDSLEAHIRTSVKQSVRQEYDQDENVRRLFDTIQSKLHCCGAERPTDWTRGKQFNMGISSNDGSTYNVPESCCRTGITPTDCRGATVNIQVGKEPDKKLVYNDGCYTLIYEWLKDSCCIILIVGGVILGVQVIGLILGLIIACSMNRSHRYKA
ncbi:CD63 antigen-like [Diabrotica virgifera virgifera]|uniref:Tetraspanin n=1 Tax=Diabrotica virgifera virgifera TaxID=50390 RepID=A0A6P7FR42_DIAVI|nr:CD63 antigen-like [Diabrotica virgifera virgifera]